MKIEAYFKTIGSQSLRIAVIFSNLIESIEQFKPYRYDIVIADIHSCQAFNF
jgi:hypothetical protein